MEAVEAKKKNTVKGKTAEVGIEYRGMTAPGKLCATIAFTEGCLAVSSVIVVVLTAAESKYRHQNNPGPCPDIYGNILGLCGSP